MKTSIREIFSEQGCLKKCLPSFEKRPQQIEMAEVIQKAIEANKNLLVEAPTGIGKSIAYLVPFISWCKENKTKVLISTYTKTLQEQLTKKDIPFLKRCLDIDLKYALCVGSENYLCRRRLEEVWQHSLFDSKEEIKEFDRLSKWAKNTDTGLRMDLDFEPSDEAWAKVCREPDLCFPKFCLYRENSECFYTKAKKIEAKADILVANHFLFFTNLASKDRILPKYDAVVLDEAHNIEEAATKYLGIEISNFSVKFLLDRIFNEKNGKGLLSRIPELNNETLSLLVNQVREVKKSSEQFFNLILDEFGSDKSTKRIRANNSLKNLMFQPLTDLYEKLITIPINDAMISEETKAFANKCLSLRNTISTFLEQGFPDYVYWIEIIPRKKNIKVELHAVPIDISNILNKELFSKTKPIVLTSATLTVNKSFSFIKERLGINDCLELLLDSPFDYKKQTLLYIEGNLPDPFYEPFEYKENVISKIEELIKITKGRTFILFTSYELLKKANKILKINFEELQLISQGEMQRWQMIENFKKGEIDILLGTNTFWQGVDVPGKALECVIIPKLPFSVPNEPITEAKMEHLANQGKDPFIYYSLPIAIIRLKQGFGRLIRTKNDRGVVAILDPRIKTRYYGRWFIESLPPCTITQSIDDIQEFYQTSFKSQT